MFDEKKINEIKIKKQNNREANRFKQILKKKNEY